MTPMASRLVGRIARRPSLPLTARDVDDLAMLRTSPELRLALASLCPDEIRTGEVTESALLHAVWATGMAAVREKAEAAGYAALAASMTTAETAENQAFARRRVPQWVHEE